MSFGEAVSSGFDHYARFDGRASRPAYWWWILFQFLAVVGAIILDSILGTSFIASLVVIGLLLPGLSVSVRRLHDTNRSGWWILVSLIPLIGFIVLLIFYIQDSDQGENNYGPPMGASPSPAA